MKILLFSIVVSLLLAACCQGECLPCGTLISFEKFKAVDVDTILVVQYAPGQNAVRDSQWIYTPTTPGDTTQAQVMQTAFCGSDWKIFIPAVNRQYVINDIKTEKKKCPCDPGKQLFMQEYKVNGISHQELTLVLQ